MNTTQRGMVIVLLIAPVLLDYCACGHRRKPELNELYREAFAEATKRYVLSDAAIDSQYNQRVAVPCPPKATVTKETSPRPEQRKGLLDFSDLDTSKKNPNESITDYADRLRCEARRKMFRVPAVASVRGVQLSPSNQANVYIIKFDFEPSKNPHSEIPENKITAEKFERPDGTYYWVIGW